MSFDIKKLTPQEQYKLIGKLIEEIKLRKYSYQTGKAYISVVKRFLKSGKTPREFLLSYSNKNGQKKTSRLKLAELNGRKLDKRSHVIRPITS